MKVAVCYENGAVFQHFGHTEQFKVYTIEDNKIVSSEVIGTDGAGHEALADFLKARGITSLICGGIGGGAVAALSADGITIYAGNNGNADDAAQKLASGLLSPNAVANCNHHEEHANHESDCHEPKFHLVK
jgi:predicted Fe-Mo cluster-binding NifX family protein